MTTLLVITVTVQFLTLLRCFAARREFGTQLSWLLLVVSQAVLTVIVVARAIHLMSVPPATAADDLIVFLLMPLYMFLQAISFPKHFRTHRALRAGMHAVLREVTID